MGISENFNKLIRNSELWFATPTSFNDPFDCQINDNTNWTDESIRNYLRKINTDHNMQINIEENIIKNKENPQYFKNLFTNSFKSTVANQGVACFVASPLNMLMWAHYSLGFTGVCLKFDTTKDFDLFEFTFPVIYRDHYPKYDFIKNEKDTVKEIILTKAKFWEYENEIRVLKENFGAYRFKKDCLKEIIFGCKTEVSKINEIKTIINKIDYPNLKLRKMKLNTSRFDFEIIDLE